MVAIGRLVMSTRERICAIEIEEGGLVLTTLRTAEEVRALDEVALPELPKPDPKINYAIADDMLSDLVYSVERDLEHQSEAGSMP
jgi:non-homologous end joining protein Ku